MSKEVDLHHVGFIMDGNRRWARKHGLRPYEGHSEGVKRIEPIVERGAEKGISYLTFWAFSTENWKREQQEVDVLMQVFRQAIKDPMIDRLTDNGVQVRIIGDHTAFPSDIREGVEKIASESKHNDRITVNFALNYGGATEVKDAVNALISQGKKSVTEEDIFNNLYTAGQPNPDFIIRTGGEQRTSGFLPLQAMYSELYFPEVLWPDFTVEEFDKAIDVYKSRERRFGK